MSGRIPSKVKPFQQLQIKTWERPLNEYEYRVLYYVFKEVAFVCDYVKDKADRRGFLPYRARVQPDTEWPRWLVQWNQLVQAMGASYLLYWVMRFLTWVLF